MYYTHKHISVTKFVNSNKQPQTIKLVYAYNLLVLGLNRGSPSEEKTSMKKHFVHSLTGHLIEAARLLLDIYYNGTFHHEVTAGDTGGLSHSAEVTAGDTGGLPHSAEVTAVRRTTRSAGLDGTPDYGLHGPPDYTVRRTICLVRRTRWSAGLGLDSPPVGPPDYTVRRTV